MTRSNIPGMEMEIPTSQLAQVSGGNIEYALVGNGPTVLVSHGTLGGFDQALAITQLFDREAFSFLAISRAGYLRSSPAMGRTPEEQARSFVELLDHEEIAHAAVLGLSGGAPAALSFARDYPDRCWALVLISSITMAPPPLPLFFQMAIRMQGITMRINPLWALVYKHGLGLLVRSNGVHPNQVAQIFQDPHLYSIVKGIFRPVKSSSSRLKGFRLDDAQIQSLPVEREDGIDVPTYISHAANDPLASPSHAARLANSIPGAEYHQLPDGGHLFFVVHSDRVVPDIERFLLANAPE